MLCQSARSVGVSKAGGKRSPWGGAGGDGLSEPLRNPEWGRRAAQWRKRLARFESSPLSVVRFCQRERISVTSCYYWRKKFADQSPASGSVGRSNSKALVFQPATAVPAAPALAFACLGGCHRALENWPPMGAAKPASVRTSRAIDRLRTPGGFTGPPFERQRLLASCFHKLLSHKSLRHHIEREVASCAQLFIANSYHM